MRTLDELTRSPNPLAAHYSRFRVGERTLLTGHSHQAWPDVAFEGQIDAWIEAAEQVDDKWSRAEEKARRVRRGYARLLGAAEEEIALGQNTHELVVRLLSALPLRDRPRLVTTDGEFHALRRQLDRLAEEGVVEVVKVSADPAAAVAERLTAAVNKKTAAVLASSVLFGNAHIVSGLGGVLAACRAAGAELLVDAYHQINIVPFSLEREGLGEAFIVGAGYKYCQLGEGNAYLRVPPHGARLRPVVTGWFSEFAKLSERPDGQVPYGAGPARWAGATYDPTSHYRAARVFDFFEQQGLTPELLREVSRHQIGLLAERFDALDLDPRLVDRDRSVPLDRIGGFLSLRSRSARELYTGLHDRGILTDYRGDLLRVGPAPYISDQQLRAAMEALGEVASSASNKGGTR